MDGTKSVVSLGVWLLVMSLDNHQWRSLLVKVMSIRSISHSFGQTITVTQKSEPGASPEETTDTVPWPYFRWLLDWTVFNSFTWCSVTNELGIEIGQQQWLILTDCALAGHWAMTLTTTVHWKTCARIQIRFFVYKWWWRGIRPNQSQEGIQLKSALDSVFRWSSWRVTYFKFDDRINLNDKGNELPSGWRCGRWVTSQQEVHVLKTEFGCHIIIIIISPTYPRLLTSIHPHPVSLVGGIHTGVHAFVVDVAAAAVAVAIPPRVVPHFVPVSLALSLSHSSSRRRRHFLMCSSWGEYSTGSTVHTKLRRVCE